MINQGYVVAGYVITFLGLGAYAGVDPGPRPPPLGQGPRGASPVDVTRPADEVGATPPPDARPHPADRRPPGGRRGLVASLVLVAVVGALAFVAVKALGDASLFF